MRTLVVSDLHLGTLAEADLLRRATFRAPLLERLRRDVDRLVLLGDFVELRETPVGAALSHALPVLHELGQAVPEIVISGGNHDHQLVGGWVEQHDGTLGLEHRIPVREAGTIALQLADAAAPAHVELSYPGVWIRDDVYAHHGHYLDLHTMVPTIERLAAGTMSRLMAPLPDHGATPSDYEAPLVPLYAWMYALAQQSNDSAARAGARSSARAWTALAGEGRRKRPLRAAALMAALHAGTAAFNLAGIGPLKAQLSGPALRRGSLHGIGEVLSRLGVQAEHVLFGHTHRAGPWPEDDAGEWRAPTGSRLYNTGSWVYQPHFLSRIPGEGPYWPGTVIIVDDSGPPRLERLLADRTHAELRGARA